MSANLDALKAAATEGKSLKPVERLKLKLEGLQKQMSQAIPQTMQKYLTPERITRLFWQEARRNPTLTKCEPETVASSLMTACQLGIEIGVQGQGWLIPYMNRKKGVHEAQFIIGYKGLIALARRSGEVQSIETHIVYAKDKFDLQLGIDTKVEHIPFLDGERGPAKLVYGVARFRDGGGYHFEWMSLDEVQRIRMRSKAKDDGPWQTDFEQMVRKTLIRRMANYLPMSIEFANALAIDGAVADGKKAALDGEFVEIQEAEEDNDVPARLENKPGETVPISKATKKQTVDRETGEIKAQQASAEPEALTYAQVAEHLQKAEDVDLLDIAADFIQMVKDEVQRSELTELYKQRKQELSK